MKRSLLVSLGNVIARIKSNAKYRMFVLYSMILNLDHIITLFETQGTFSTLKFISDLIIEKGEKKAIKELTRSSDFIKAKFIMETMMKEGKEHPKMDKLILMFGNELKNKKCMVFVQYVEQAKYIAGLLTKKGYPAQFFIGKRKSYNKQQQEQTLQDFRDSKFNILVASSIGEEGIDIPSTDAVIFYEPVPSEIRLIQRRGRTGRAHKGEVFILITRGTRDEAYHWVSKKKETKMYSLINIVNEELESRRKDRERLIQEKKMVQEQKPKKKIEVKEQENINANEKSGLQRKLNDYF
ncbi:MAG: helicase-related protein [Candidatus Micrarchaeota archaeon]|nr:helicase-related protein [Candidatus Micrarchaeota archaeon]